jgi:hypothetical protein
LVFLLQCYQGGRLAHFRYLLYLPGRLRGKDFGGNVSKGVDAVIGGWQFGGTARLTSGFPASVYMGLVWPTNWDEMGWADLTGQPIRTGTTIVDGTPNAFKNPA